MVLPTQELPSTLTPFAVLTPEEEGSGGGAPECDAKSESFDGKTGNLQCDKNNGDDNSSNRNNQFSSDSATVSLAPPNNNFLSEEQRQLICGTKTLGEERISEDDISKGRTSILSSSDESDCFNKTYGDNNNYIDDSNNNANSDGRSNKILNLLNARNSSFLSAAQNSPANIKFSEDELFSDLKSRFIEKHFRTILRSQQANKNTGDKNGTTNKRLFAGNVLKNELGNNEKNDGSKFGTNTLLKSLKIITVERPEPQLDLPRISYLKSTKEKFFKMHDQAKSHAAERYRKLCQTLRTRIWPQLHPVQVLIEVILSNLFMICVLPFALCAVMLLCVMRMCVEIVLKIRYKGRYKLMSGSDAAWAHQSFANDSSFLSLYVIQGDCSISRIRERIMKSVINCQDPRYPGKLTYSRLRCRITEKFGFHCWEALHPMDFCIDDHVRYITNDPSAVLTQEQVLREVQKFIDQPLPEDQPQWQILVVPKFIYSKEHNDHYSAQDNLEDDGFGNFDTITVKKKPLKNNNIFYTGNHYYALVWRINHALMDGLSAANCLQHCIADVPVKLTVDPLQSLNISCGTRLLAYLKMAVFGSRSLLRSMLHRDLNCFHGPGLTGPKTLAWSRGIRLDMVRSIRKKNVDTTTTAVLTSAVGSSLRGMAIRKNNPVPKEIRAGVTCALLPYPNINPQNRFTVAHLKMRLEPESHKERLQHVKMSAREMARSADVIKNYGLIRAAGLFPKQVIPWFMDNCEATVLISNIPGPMEEYTIFQGQRLVDIIAWNTIKGNTAIGVCLFSYAGRIRAGVIADGSVMPSSSDVPALIEEFEKDLINLAKDADVKEKDMFMEVL